MDSDKKPIVSEEKRLCDECREFYGSIHTNYLCSKCHREKQHSQVNALSQIASIAPPTPVDQEQIKCEPVEVKVEPLQAVSRPIQEKKNRCWKCNKKVGLMGFDCKCGYIYCSKHRHVEDHNCDYDYFKEAQQHLKKSNPVIAFDKVSKI